MIARTAELRRVRALLGQFPVVGIIGARQVGKSTLAAMVASSWRGRVETFDLEKQADATRLAQPSLALESLTGLVIIDEIQHAPHLFAALRHLADRRPLPARFLVLGSASPSLLRQSSESLAGRIAYHDLTGFGLDEVGAPNAKRLWLRGGFPLSYTARSVRESATWRHEFSRTFIERDLPQLGVSIPAVTLRRFWSMLAHWHGQVWNAAEFARSFAMSEPTTRKYLDIFTSALVVRQLTPWHENLAKRQVKSPKIYVADSGLLHSLLGIGTESDLQGHPKVGASWEGFVIGQLIRRLNPWPEDCHFWAAHTGAELDLLVVHGQQRRGYEVKLTDAPRVTRSMRTALADLKLDSLDVIHAGAHTFPMEPKVRAVALERLWRDVKPLR